MIVYIHIFFLFFYFFPHNISKIESSEKLLHLCISVTIRDKNHNRPNERMRDTMMKIQIALLLNRNIVFN